MTGGTHRAGPLGPKPQADSNTSATVKGVHRTENLAIYLFVFYLLGLVHVIHFTTCN
jgi:hypothetical protein